MKIAEIRPKIEVVYDTIFNDKAEADLFEESDDFAKEMFILSRLGLQDDYNITLY